MAAKDPSKANPKDDSGSLTHLGSLQQPAEPSAIDDVKDSIGIESFCNPLRDVVLQLECASEVQTRVRSEGAESAHSDCLD